MERMLGKIRMTPSSSSPFPPSIVCETSHGGPLTVVVVVAVIVVVVVVVVVVVWKFIGTIIILTHGGRW